MNGFHDVRFPTDISFGSSGGPQRSTDIVVLGSGHERRNQRWADSRRRYDAGYGIKDLNALYAVVDFYEAPHGPLYGFRFRDPLDWKSCPPMNDISPNDQELGIGDGNRADFQIVKRYGSAEQSYQRTIEFYEPGSLLVAVSGTVVEAGVDFDLEENGLIKFRSGSIPLADEIVTAGYEFDVPVRFESDELSISLSSFNSGEVPAIPLSEVRL